MLESSNLALLLGDDVARRQEDSRILSDKRVGFCFRMFLAKMINILKGVTLKELSDG